LGAVLHEEEAHGISRLAGDLDTLPAAGPKLTDISVIVSHVEEGLPTIISVTDVASGAVNTKLTPGGGLTGSGQRIKTLMIVGSPSSTWLTITLMSVSFERISAVGVERSTTLLRAGSNCAFRYEIFGLGD